jgi:hypothetical protein
VAPTMQNIGFIYRRSAFSVQRAQSAFGWR